MTFLDWAIVFILNGAVIAYGFYLAQKTESSNDWFLAGRSLPWWGLGLSIFATSLDNADVISLPGHVYNNGMHIITIFTLATVIGACLAGFYIVPFLYRAGFYTNAEFLESRFGNSLRVISALIQIQYRTSILGLMIWSIYLMLKLMVGFSDFEAWGLIFVLVVLTTSYTVWGGLTSVVWTDAMQSFIIMAGAVCIFVSLWNVIGGWTEMKEKISDMPDLVWIEEKGWVDLSHLPENEKPNNSENLQTQSLDRWFHLASFKKPTFNHSGYIIVLGWIIIGCGYYTVNHTQTMRLLGARSIWDMKMSVVLGSALGIPIMMGIALLGIYGRILVPELTATGQKADDLFPILAKTYLQPGLKGLVVAGIVSATVSTFDSMGSALSALFTRDIYARWLVQNKTDHHYITVGRWATIGMMLLGFLFVPFIASKRNMIDASLSLINVFVTPLLTIYLTGVLTRVHQKSGLIGLMCGASFGILGFISREFDSFLWLKSYMPDLWIAYPCSMIITASGMFLTTLILGKVPADFFQKIQTIPAEDESNHSWLNESRESLPEIKEHPFKEKVPVFLKPEWYAIALLALTSWIIFGLFW